MYLIYNDTKIEIEKQNMVCVTDIYNANKKPKNKSPHDFSKSKIGAEIIRKYKSQKGTYAWQTKKGKDTRAFIDIAYEYTKYLGDKEAGDYLLKVAQTGQNLKYNTPNKTQNDLNSIPKNNSNNVSDMIYTKNNQSENTLATLLGLAGAIWIFLTHCTNIQQNNSNQYEEPQQQHLFINKNKTLR